MAERNMLQADPPSLQIDESPCVLPTEATAASRTEPGRNVKHRKRVRSDRALLCLTVYSPLFHQLAGLYRKKLLNVCSICSLSCLMEHAICDDRGHCKTSDELGAEATRRPHRAVGYVLCCTLCSLIFSVKKPTPCQPTSCFPCKPSLPPLCFPISNL